MAHSLVETWHRREGHLLTLQGFRKAGGVAGAISQTADSIYNNQFSPAEQVAAQRLFLRLVAPGEETPDTKRILSHADIDNDPDPDVMRRVVEWLTKARLLTVDDENIQIIHEALLRTWPRLRMWIEASRDELRMRQRISRAASEWEAEGRNPDLLYRGTLLLTALEWAEKNPVQLGKLEWFFLEAAEKKKVELEAVAATTAHRRRMIRRVTIAALSFLAVGATLASLVAFFAWREARLNESRAMLATAEAQAQFSAALATGAYGMVNTDPLLGLVLAAESVARSRERPPSYDARATLLAARHRLTGMGPFVVGSPIAAGDALSIALRPDGSMIASAQRNGTIELISTLTRQRIGISPRGHAGGIRDVDFSPDGHLLVSAGADGSLRLWEVGKDGFTSGGRQIGQSSDVIMAARFSPDGTVIATGNGEGSVQLWRIGQVPPNGETLIDLPTDFNAIAFSHDGRNLIASNANGTIFGWQLPSHEPLFQPIVGVHTSHLLRIVFSPNGRHIATVSTDGTSMVLEHPAGHIVGQAFDSGSRIGSVVFNHDGRILMGGDDQGAIGMWDVERQQILSSTPRGHNQAIVDIERSSDGRWLATLGRDQTIRLWQANTSHPLFGEFQVVGESAKSVTFSQDGRFLAAGDDSGRVQVWDLDRHRLSLVLEGHTTPVWGTAFSPDRQLLASGDRSGKIHLWNLLNGTSQRVINAHKGSIWSMAFDTSGSQLISTSDQNIRIWQTDSGTLTNTLEPPSGQLTRATLSPNGKMLAGTTTDGKVWVWNLENGSVVRDIHAGDDVQWSAAFSPDMRHLALASSEEVVTVWDLDKGNRQSTFTGHMGGATDLAYLSDGVTLVVVDRQGMIHWWDTETGRRLYDPWPAHQGTSWRMAHHPDGQRVATAGDDGKIRIWNQLSIPHACEIAKDAFDRVRHDQYLGKNTPSVACD